MPDLSQSTITRAAGAIGCTLVLALAATAIASTQSRSAADPYVAALQQQLAALDRRVKELEKSASNVSGPDDPGPANRIKKLEDQVRKLEAAEQARDGARPAGTPEQLGLRLTAPFTVVDSSGKLLMRVTDQGNGFSRGAYLYDGNEKIVGHIGGDAAGGRIYATKNGLLPQAMITAVEAPSLFLRGAQKPAVTLVPGSITFFSDSGTPLSVFGTKDRFKGYMELNDGSGSKMVEAGMLNSHVGYVLASPSRSSVGINGNPSVLMGGAGR